jgi:hypothetical protein
MIVCHNPKFVYYAPPKTGTTSLDKIFRDAGFIGTKERDAKHLIAEVPDLAAKGYYFFITVRSPFTRTVSCWRYIQHRLVWSTDAHRQMHEDLSGISFRDFVLNTDWASEPLASMLKRQSVYHAAMPACQHIIRMENFVRGVRALPFLPNDQAVPCQNTTDGLMTKLYDAETADKVAAFYRDDFRTFGYSHHDRIKL